MRRKGSIKVMTLILLAIIFVIVHQMKKKISKKEALNDRTQRTITKKAPKYENYRNVEVGKENTKLSRKTIPDNFYDFLYGNAYIKALNRAAAVPKKKIIFWHPVGDLRMTEDRDLSWECGGCQVRNDLKMIDDKSTEAVVIRYKSPLPEKRNPKHYWIWRTAEAPPMMAHLPWVNSADKVGYNLTFTHRRDSDIVFRYGNSFSLTKQTLENPLKNKEKLALVAISNCNGTPGAKVRYRYIKELLNKGLQLTAIGRCFSSNPQDFPKEMKNQFRQFTSKHKFYFAMENSFHCKDYVTEKFFRALQAGVVPVVWGATRETYDRHIPASGFIFIEDFPSTQSLIDHLNYLDKNDTAYLEYFRWRGERKNHPDYRLKGGSCQICRFLHGINVDEAYKLPPEILLKNRTFIGQKPERKVIHSLNKWWQEAENPDCLQRQLGLDKKGRIIIEKRKILGLR